MLDCTWFASDDASARAQGGQWAGGHHLVNVAVHAAATAALFLALVALSIGRGVAATTAALFGLHPQHVESVAWVAERKDVLSGLFWMLALLAYAAWVRRPSAARYVLVAAAFALGLMSKAMVVTLPFVLLLLDAWPLQRAGANAGAAAVPWRRLVLEKAPLFLLAAAIAAVTFVSQRQAGSMRTEDNLPLLPRLANASCAYLDYLLRTVWPFDLAIFYPHPYLAAGGAVTPGFAAKAAAGAAALAAITWLALRQRRTRPWLLVGWLWYLGTLVPVIGLVQVGAQASADRYSYLPLIGVFVAAASGVAELCARRGWPTRVPAAAAALVVAACAVQTARQAATWRSDATVFGHAVAAVPDNHLAYNHLGLGLHRRGDLAGAAAAFDRAIRIRPDYDWALNNRAVCALAARDLALAEQLLRRALAKSPAYADAWNNLGSVAFLQRRFDDASRHYERAVATARSERPDYQLNLGLAWERLGRRDDALQRYLAVLRAVPDHAVAAHRAGVVLAAMGRLDDAERGFARMAERHPAEARHGLGLVAARRGDDARAVASFEAALAARADFGEAHRDLARAQLRRREWATAARHGERALAIDGDDADVHNDLGIAHAQLHARERADEHFRQALRLQPDHAAAAANLATLQSGGLPDAAGGGR
jgi:tetratricopeptide (TPR) repeat protein